MLKIELNILKGCSSSRTSTKKCYDPVPDGKSGNLKLNSNCSYCAFKDKCWASANNGQGLRKFRYSNGIQEFVEVFNTPRVEEILPLSKKDV